MDVAKYKSLFLSESREYINSMSEAVLQLKKQPTPELCDHLFRLAHSIKGLAASMGYTDLKDVSHRLEDLFDRFKATGTAPDDAGMSTVFQGLGILDMMLGEIDASGATKTNPAEFLKSMSDLLARVSSSPVAEQTPRPELELIIPQRPEPPAAESGEKLFFKIDVKIADDTTLPAARAIVAIKRVEELGRISRLTPSLEEVKAGNFTGQLCCYLVTSASAPEIQEQISSLPDIQKVVVTPVDPHTRQAPGADAAPSTLAGDRLRESFRMNSVRVETHLLDRVVEGLGELLILNAQLQDNIPDNPDAARLHLLVQRIYQHALDLRMLPFKTLTAHFPRVVQDLAQRLQKKVDLHIEGAELHLDKSILDELADPLIHLLRNALDHGIEPPALREKIGKPESGKLTLSISKQGDRVLIRMEDDGKGLDPVLIRKAAIKKGLVSERMASFLNQNEVLMLLTRPGFSTAETVSDISGRGVGLDVVREKIESLGGTFTMHSVPGQFTRFDLIVPFTIALLPALLFRAGGMQFAAPLTRIDRFLMIRRNDVHYTQSRPVIFQNNSTYYIERLENNLKRTTIPELPEEFPAFVTEHQNRRIAWIVDELISERQILLKSLQPPLNELGCYSGATILGKGEVVPVVDLEHLYRERYQ